MGSAVSYVWWGGDPEAVHPVTGLTRREVYSVQKSWALVYKDPIANGTELLKRLFHTYPDTLQFFKMVRKLPEEEWAGNCQFKAHVVSLMGAINEGVNNLNQPEVVAAMMQSVGKSHKRRRIREQEFQSLKNVIVKMYIDLLDLDEYTLAAWGKAVDFWYKNIFETLN